MITNPIRTERKDKKYNNIYNRLQQTTNYNIDSQPITTDN